MSCMPPLRIALAILAVLTAGCFPTQPRYWNEQRGGDLSYYLDQATNIEYPDVTAARLEEVSQSRPPITVVDPDFERFYDLTLEECVSMALQNSKVIRGYGTPGLQGTRVTPGIDNLTNGINGVGTLYNIAIRESEPGFIGQPGQIQDPGFVNTNTGLDANQGVEAALAEFDAQYSAQAFWGRSDEPRNTLAPFDQQAFRQDQVTLQHEIAKKTAEGTQLFLRNTNVYTNNNIPLTFQLLPSWWRAAIEFEVRQPLLRGRGAFINRMPIVISRIGTDQEIANLEAQLQNMVANVEIRYWDLQLAYRILEAAKDGRDAALETWRIVKAQFDAKADVNIQQVAQAKGQYHFFDGQVIDAYNTLLTAEADLRFLLGIAQSDGQLIRPIDEAVLAPVEFDYCASLEEALEFRPELRQQRWEIKKKELSYAYAKNSLLPVLNATGLYRWLGLGDKFVSYDDPAPNFGGLSAADATGSGATNELLEGRFQEFQLGLEYRVPIGLRREMANVMNAQIKLAREQARIEDMELDTSRELQQTLRAIAANRDLLHTSFNQWVEASIEVDHFKELAAQGTATLNIALDAQRSRAQAQQSFYSALAEYNKSIALFHRRKGTILAYNGISMGEGPWAGKAYQDASELARARSASRQVNYGWTRPEVISRGTGGPLMPSSSAPVNESMETIPVDSWSEPVMPNSEILEEGVIEEEVPGDIILNEAFDDPALIPLGANTVVDPRVQQAGCTAAQTARAAAADYLQNLKRMPAPTLPKPDSLTAPTPKSTPPIQVQDVDWGRFGLSNPNLSDGNVNARIKSPQ